MAPHAHSSYPIVCSIRSMRWWKKIAWRFRSTSMWVAVSSFGHWCISSFAKQCRRQHIQNEYGHNTDNDENTYIFLRDFFSLEFEEDFRWWIRWRLDLLFTSFWSPTFCSSALLLPQTTPGPLAWIGERWFWPKIQCFFHVLTATTNLCSFEVVDRKTLTSN